VFFGLDALQVLCRNPKEITMSIRSMLVAAAFASLEPAHGDGLRPIDAISVHVGEVSGVAYYTVERDGFHVVTTLAQGMTGMPIRVVCVLAPGQSVAFSTPHQVNALEMAPSQRTEGRWRGRAWSAAERSIAFSPNMLHPIYLNW
jgi:hypothetical protein